MLTARTSDSRRPVSISRSCPTCSAPMVGTNPILFLDSRKSRTSLTVWTTFTYILYTSTIAARNFVRLRRLKPATTEHFIQSPADDDRLPDLPEKVVLGNFGKHRFIRVPQAIVNEAHVRAPALVTSDSVRFIRACGRFPEDLQVHVHVAKISDRLSQFACPDTPVEVDHRGSLARGAPHRPSSRPVEVLKLCPVVKCKCSNIRRFLDPFHKAVLVVEHAVGIAPLNLR